MRPRVLVTILAAAIPVVPFAVAASPADVRVAPAQDGRRGSLADHPDLWATINVCDTAAYPDTMGIRGSMPGLGVRTKLRMRFSVQYLARADGKWHTVDEAADSGWIPLGRVRDRVVESGQNFRFEPPVDGGAHRLRGVVRYKWVRRDRAVRRARRFTEAGHRSTAGADPEGYSAAMCDIS